MDIGTAKPSENQQKKIKHFLVDIKEPSQPINVKQFQSIAQKSFLDMGKCYYIFLFRTLQSMIWNLSYPVYRHYFESVRKQIVRNHKNLLNRFFGQCNITINKVNIFTFRKF